jgi:hypothetical protein
LANFKAKFYLRRITDSLFIQLLRNAKLINDLLSNVEFHVRVSSPAQTGCDPRGSYSMDIHLAHCLCQGVKDLPPDTGIARADGAISQVRNGSMEKEIGYGCILFGKVTGSRNCGSIGGKSRYSCSVCFCCTYFSSHA